MKFPIGAFLAASTRAIMLAATSINAVEQFASQTHGQTGAEKRESVLTLIQNELRLAELATGRDLADDADVKAAAGVIIDGIVAFQNVLGAKSRKATT